MKKLILMALVVLTGASAAATDRMSDEILCAKVRVPGEADNGLRVVLQSNPTAWKKQIVIFEEGVFGSSQIASFQVPLQPKSHFTVQGGWTVVYEAKDIQLAMQVQSTRDGYRLLGPAVAFFKTASYGGMKVLLSCRNAN